MSAPGFGALPRLRELPLDPPEWDENWCAKCEEPHRTDRDWRRCEKRERELAEDAAAEAAIDDARERRAS